MMKAKMHDKKRKRKVPPVLLILLGALVIVGGVSAYYRSQDDLQNRLITKGSEVFLKELFSPNDEWVPGETKEKAVMFGNRGELAQVVRFRVTEAWYDNRGTPGNLTDDTPWAFTGTYNPKPAVIRWTGGGTGPPVSDWVKLGDWYYYTRVLPKGTSAAPAMTPQVMDGVTFSPAISNAGPGAADDFTNKRYALTLQMESLDVSSGMTETAWHAKFTESGGSLSWSASP